MSSVSMDIVKRLDLINSKKDFVEFMYTLKKDKIDNANEWESKDIETYIETIGSWVEDMDGYYRNLNKNIPTNIDWKFIATLFYVGKIYE